MTNESLAGKLVRKITYGMTYKVGRPAFKTLQSLYPKVQRRFNIVMGILTMELGSGSSVDIPLGRRLWLWRHGFTSRVDVLLDVTEESRDRYLSDYQEGLTHRINDGWVDSINNKLTAQLLLMPFEEHLPGFFGMLDDGEVVRYPAFESEYGEKNGNCDFEVTDAVSHIETLLADLGKVVLKPLRGRGGSGVYLVEHGAESGDYLVNGDEYSQAEFAELVEGLEEYIIHEFVQQSDFMDELYPNAANTIRILTMWDEETDEPFIAFAHGRIGVDQSAPVDSNSQGGLQAWIDVETGEIEYTATVSRKEAPIGFELIDEHPSTGSQITGRTIPEWEEISDEILRIASAYPYIEYIGWDVLLTGDGDFKLLELNASVGLLDKQIQEQFLDDPRVRKFYERHGVM